MNCLIDILSVNGASQRCFIGVGLLAAKDFFF